jgi:hypothetical protein
MVWAGICHDVRTQLIIVQGTLNAVKYRDDIIVLSFCPFCNSETLITSFNMTMQDVTWLLFVKTFWTKITSVFFLGRHYHWICHQLNIYGMNSVARRRVRHRQNPPETLQELRDALVHECNNIPQAFIQRLIGYASEMRSCRCCKRWSHTLLNSENIHTAWQFLSVHDLFW